MATSKAHDLSRLLADGVVGSTEIGDAQVTNAKIADNAVNTAKIANGSITSDKLNVQGSDIPYDNTTSGISANTLQEAIDYLNVLSGGGSAGAQATYTREKFTATSGQTTFTTTSGYTLGYLQVFMNGVMLDTSDYAATDESTVVLGTGAAAGDEIVTIAYDSFAISEVLRTLSISSSAPDDSLTINASGDLVLNGSKKLLVGNGISTGTTTPVAGVHIASSGVPQLLLDAGGDDDGDIVVPTGEKLQIGHWEQSTATYTPRMIMLDNGDLGIGRISPNAPLHIERSGASSAEILLTSSSAYRENGIRCSNSDELTLFADDTNVGTSSAVRVHVDGSEVARFTGNSLSMASGNGITFDGGSNYLDDYEEGTFTITSTRAGVAETSGGWLGQYVKIGALVHVTISTNNYVNHNSTNGNGDAFVITSNLPFTPRAYGGSQVAQARSLGEPERIAVAWKNNSTVIYLNRTGANNAYYPTNNVTTNTTQTNVTLQWSGTYFTYS